MEYYSYGNEESPSSYYLYSYNGTLLKSTILYSYRSNLEEYIISTATYYSYDINDREIEKVNEIYYTGVLNSVSVDSFFYEGDNLTKHLVYKGDNLDEVTFDHEIILLYDSSDRVIKNTWYEYDQDEEFRIKQQHTFIYTSTLLDTSTFTSYHFHNGDSYHSIYTYEYDEMDNLLRIEGRQNNSTEITKTTNFTYFDDNFLESYHVLYSDLTLGETKIIYHYGNPVLPSFESTIEPIISIFPNPTSDYLRFETSAQIQEINVFSINGQLHMNIDNPKTNNINIHNLPSGIYTIQLSIMNKVYNKLFVKE